VQSLGSSIYGAGIHPYTARTLKHAAIFGLDTEWYQGSDGHNRFLCWQLSLNETTTQIYLADLSWEALYSESIAMLKSNNIRLTDVTTMVYAVYLATAEAQWLLGSGLPDSKTRIESFGAHRLHIRYRARSHRNMVLFDLSNWTGENNDKSLAAMARTFGLEKQSYDVSSLTPDSLADPVFCEYAANDATVVGEILRRLRDKIISDTGIDILLSKTPASTAANHFRAQYIPRTQIGTREVNVKRKDGSTRHGTRRVYAQVQQRNSCARRYALMASHGGRKEMMYRGELSNCYEYDAVSAYPSSVMLLDVLPLEDDIKSTADMKTWLKAKGGWGCVRFTFPSDTMHPCLPVETEGKQTVFPLHGWSYCTTFQVRVAIEMGADIWLQKGYYYNSGVNWLAEYERTLTDKRYATNDPAMQGIYKMMANSIIGKLTQKVHEYDLNDIVRVSRENGIPVEVLKGIANLESMGVKRKVATGSLFMPEWNTLILGWFAANVSSLAAQCNAVQIATDAVFTTEYRGERFEHRGILYKLEEQGPYVAVRPGFYQIDNKIKHHAAPRSIAPEVFAAFLRGEDTVHYQRTRIVSLKQAMNAPGLTMGETSIIPARVNLGFDGKRVLHSDGTTEPLRSCWDIKPKRRELVWAEP